MEINCGRLSHLLVMVFLSCFTACVIVPALTDVIVEAVCSGKEECSLSIYLTGSQQAITGLGAMFMMPLIGKLSDVYGRKTILQILLILTVIPLVILAWKRTTNYFYVYYAFRTLTGMVTDSGVLCLSFAYLGDNVTERGRISGFGLLVGVAMAANVCGTIIARLLSISQMFQVAAAVSIVTVVYVRVFLEEKTQNASNTLEQPILKHVTECESLKKISFIQEIPSPKNIFHLLKSSITFSLVGCASFCTSLVDAGDRVVLFYFLKAEYQFEKDQYANMLLINFSASTLSNLFFLPVVGPYLGEETLLLLAMLAGFLNMFFTSIAWSSWVIYAASSLGFFFSLASPILKSLVSKHSGPNEQGIAQGSIFGIVSLASLISPLIFSPISATFLSEEAPFHFPGFGVLCVGFAYLVGFFLSIWILILPYFPRDGVRRSNHSNEA